LGVQGGFGNWTPRCRSLGASCRRLFAIVYLLALSSSFLPTVRSPEPIHSAELSPGVRTPMGLEKIHGLRRKTVPPRRAV
jgi:hypothetical protein